MLAPYAHPPWRSIMSNGIHDAIRTTTFNYSPSMGLSMLRGDWEGLCFQGCWTIWSFIIRKRSWVQEVLGVVNSGITNISGKKPVEKRKGMWQGQIWEELEVML
jgi:hypothetical protein